MFLTCDHADSEWRCHYDIGCIELFVQFDSKLTTRVRLWCIEWYANTEEIVKGFFLCCKLFSKLLLLGNAFPLTTVCHQDDLLDNLVGHLLKGCKNEDFRSDKCLILTTFALMICLWSTLYELWIVNYLWLKLSFKIIFFVVFIVWLFFIFFAISFFFFLLFLIS